MSPFLAKLINGTKPISAREKSAMLDAARSIVRERIFNPGLIAQAQADITEMENRFGLTKAEREEHWKSNYNPATLQAIQARHEGRGITHEQIAENQMSILEGKRRKFTAEEKAWLAKNKWNVELLHKMNTQRKAPAPAIAATAAPKPRPRASMPARKVPPTPLTYFEAYQHKAATNPAEARKFLAEHGPKIQAGAKLAPKI